MITLAFPVILLALNLFVVPVKMSRKKGFFNDLYYFLPKQIVHLLFELPRSLKKFTDVPLFRGLIIIGSIMFLIA